MNGVVAISFPKGYSQPGDQTQVSCIAGRPFTIWATRKPLYNSYYHLFPKLHHPNRHLLPLNNNPSSPQSVVTSIFCFNEFAYSGNFYKWNHILFFHLCMACFIKHVFKVHLCCSIYQICCMFPFHSWILFLYDIGWHCLSAHPLMEAWAVSTYWLLGTMLLWIMVCTYTVFRNTFLLRTQLCSPVNILSVAAFPAA